MRICRQCGNTYEDEIKFCPVCGCIVEDFAAEMIVPNPSQGKHVGKIIGIIAVCILALAAAFFALAVLVSGGMGHVVYFRICFPLQSRPKQTVKR